MTDTSVCTPEQCHYPATELLIRPPAAEPPARVFPTSAAPPAGLAAPRLGSDAAPRPAAPEPASRPAPRPAPPVPAATAAVRRRVEAVLRISLEVVDRRRRPDRLRGAATEAVMATLATLASHGPPGRDCGSARLRRIHISAAGPSAVEVCANYRRGPRVLAIAGRWELRREVWICTSLVLA